MDFKDEVKNAPPHLRRAMAYIVVLIFLVLLEHLIQTASPYNYGKVWIYDIVKILEGFACAAIYYVLRIHFVILRNPKQDIF